MPILCEGARKHDTSLVLHWSKNSPVVLAENSNSNFLASVAERILVPGNNLMTVVEEGYAF